MNKMYLVLGDWSDDGHGNSDKILIESNKSVQQIQDAYKASCRLTGISFNHHDDFTGRDRDWSEAEKYHVCTEYNQSTLSPEVIEVLNKYNCTVFDSEEYENDYYVDGQIFVELLMWFIGLSLEDFQWKRINDITPVINGYWDSNLNVQFGYGLYS